MSYSETRPRPRDKAREEKEQIRDDVKTKGEDPEQGKVGRYFLLIRALLKLDSSPDNLSNTDTETSDLRIQMSPGCTFPEEEENILGLIQFNYLVQLSRVTPLSDARIHQSQSSEDS